MTTKFKARYLTPQHGSALTAAAVLLCLYPTWHAQAQTRYTCRTASGTAYLSDRACQSAPTGIVYYGPVQGPQGRSSYIPRVAEAPDHLKYLSPRCSSLNDGIRTSAARGIRSEVVAELQRNYQRDCSEDEQNARAQLSAERADNAAAKKSAQNIASMNQQMTQIEQQQCDESKRVIFVKKKRIDLTDGEKADLKRFEETAKARCRW